MKAAELYEDIRNYCLANSSKAVVKKYSKYFTEGYDAYGLTAEIFNKKVTSILQEKTISMKLILSTNNC